MLPTIERGANRFLHPLTDLGIILAGQPRPHQSGPLGTEPLQATRQGSLTLLLDQSILGRLAAPVE